MHDIFAYMIYPLQYQLSNCDDRYTIQICNLYTSKDLASLATCYLLVRILIFIPSCLSRRSIHTEPLDSAASPLSYPKLILSPNVQEEENIYLWIQKREAPRTKPLSRSKSVVILPVGWLYENQ